MAVFFISEIIPNDNMPPFGGGVSGGKGLFNPIEIEIEIGRFSS
jgi:hypothetical protein